MEGELCGAKTTRGEGTCQLSAGHGTDHPGVGRCKFHGGCTPSHQKSAAEEMVRRGLLFYGVPQDVAPQEALLGEVHRSAGHVAFLEEQIREEDLPEEEASSKLALYQAERRHLVQVCQVALHAGVEERAVKLAERQGQMLADAIRGILEDVGVDPKAPKVRESVRARLRLVQGGQAHAA